MNFPPDLVLLCSKQTCSHFWRLVVDVPSNWCTISWLEQYRYGHSSLALAQCIMWPDRLLFVLAMISSDIYDGLLEKGECCNIGIAFPIYILWRSLFMLQVTTANPVHTLGLQKKGLKLQRSIIWELKITNLTPMMALVGEITQSSKQFMNLTKTHMVTGTFLIKGETLVKQWVVKSVNCHYVICNW